MPPKKGNAKAEQEEARRIAAKEEEEKKRVQERENQRWKDCLQNLKTAVPRLRDNPWLIVMEPNFIWDYLDSLTETLANLSKHEEDLNTVRTVLQDVYEGFVDLGRFAKGQPAFFISHPDTIKRFVRLLEQVAHKGSDKALFPNVLCLLTPTFDRPDLYDLLADAHIVNSLMSFARTDWMPTETILNLLLTIFKKLSVSARMRTLFMEDSGFEKLQAYAWGYTTIKEEVNGKPVIRFTEEEKAKAQDALALFPAPKPPDQ
mmetsp:Transcript_31269/g.60942  ORF Transcript_31269/g.60942 Transcript_31269/m.60942 type:complete len:260 (-) Transcript_31269:303-1082(-)